MQKYKKIIFIIGLHRSGTSFLHDIFRVQNNITGVKFNKDLKYNEGQYLQNCLPTGAYYGGMGNFAFNPDAHHTESSELLTKYTWQDIFKQLNEHWQKPITDVFVEKSPPNIIRTRMLQSMFPNSYFVIIMRHPICQALSNKNMADKAKMHISDIQFINNWLKSHEILFNDLTHINNKFIFTYEEFLINTKHILNKIEQFINVEFNKKEFFVHNGNLKYYSVINKYTNYEKSFNKYGYSTNDPNMYMKYSDLYKLIYNF